MSRASRLAPVAALLLLAGCAIGGPKTEVSIFAPQVRTQADPSWPSVDWRLTLGSPGAHALLDSQRIAVRPTPDRLQTYKGARWADTAPEMMQLALTEAFEDSGKITGVSSWGGGRGDFGLFTDLRAFETVYVDGRPMVVVEIQARLVKFGQGGGLVAARRFRTEVAPAGEKIEPVVAAFGEAMARVGTDIVGWTLVEGERAISARRRAAEEPAGK
ncbi:ABC-type transport auxiliary lipoprotein family protein [Arenimonas caeni]|jgi:cholesterol transport system auxiliary component|uniref:ABC transporter n=1 Tax=Arenimonas caeni TaxID=2058085 RepID=A0A2P6MAD5_9GAMM|nr:ABC-type transport auxiliary lipoprotein family protein [Arenimonas caeni]MDY0022241.1 ABC-type transport auxiliary lipoprotein family protein [Arenimonas caeni]PRH82959.1 ABC transporter [Arenimonas caeni]